MKKHRFTSLVFMACMIALLSVVSCTPEEITVTPSMLPPATESPTTPIEVIPLLPTSTVEATAGPETTTESSPPVSTESPAVETRNGDPIARLASGAELVIESVWMMDESRGWATGGVDEDRTHVLVTADGGQTFQDVTPPERAIEGTPIVEVVAAFLDADTGWVTYQRAPSPEGFIAPVVWMTVDRGMTWTPGEPLDVSGFMGFYGPSRMGFSDRHFGWLMLDLDAAMMHRYIAIYTTEDGGQHWTRVVDPDAGAPIQTGDKTGLVLSPEGTGLLTRDLRGLVEGVSVEITRDGGASWVSVQLDLPGDVGTTQLCSSHSPAVFSDRVWAVGVSCLEWNEEGDSEEVWQDGDAYLFFTYDSGGNWEREDAPGGELIYLSGDVILSLGRDLHRSEDGGQTWDFIKSVSWYADFTFISPEIGWAAARAGDERALVQTLNGGRTWIELAPYIP